MQSQLKFFGLSAANVAQHLGDGFSRASVWRVQASQGCFALKGYLPNQCNIGQLAFAHSQLLAGIEHGIEFLPRPRFTTCGPGSISWDNRLWDCVSWRPGESLAVQHVDTCAAALARLHHALRPSTIIRDICPSITRRLQAIDQARRIVHDPKVASGELLNRIRQRLPRALESAQAALTNWTQRTMPLQPVHGDCRPAHFLISAGSVTGLIDHASMRIDSVAADVARFMSELDTPNDVLTPYESIRRLSADELALVRILFDTAPIANVCGWLLKPNQVANSVVEARIERWLNQLDRHC